MFFWGTYFLILFLLIYFKNKNNLYEYPEPKKFLPITVVIPVFNEGQAISNTLQSVVDMEYPNRKKEIIVVDDCSTDNSYEIIKKFAKNHSNMRVVQTPKNTGNAAGSKNYGLTFVKTPLVAFVDSDSLPSKDSLVKMVGYFEEDEKVAAVTSRVLVKNDKGNFIKRFQALDYFVIAWSRKILDFIGCVYVTNGPLSIYKSELIKREGPFDKENLTEDIEITWNFLSKGYKTKMSYATKVYTIVPENFRIWNKQRVRWNLGGLQTVYKYKKFFFRNTGNLFGSLVINYVSVAFLFALVGFLLIIRQAYYSITPYLLAIPYYFLGYNPLKFIEFNFYISLLSFFAISFFILAYFHYHQITQELPKKEKTMKEILIYIFIYKALYIVPLLGSLVKLIKKDMRWYTK